MQKRLQDIINNRAEQALVNTAAASNSSILTGVMKHSSSDSMQGSGADNDPALICASCRDGLLLRQRSAPPVPVSPWAGHAAGKHHHHWEV